MLGSGRGGVVNEVSNLKANEQLTDTIEYMATREYQKQRDLSDVIPTHQRHLPKSSGNGSNLPAYDIKSEKAKERLERQVDGEEVGTHGKIISNGQVLLNGENQDDDDENDELMELRRQRMAQMKQRHAKEAEWLSKQHGQFREISQDDFFNIVVRERGGSELVVVHFYHKDFESCRVMDARLQELAPLMISIKFVKVDAEKSPFLVERLHIATLPCVLLFRNDIAVDRILGFEGCMSSDGNLDRSLLRERIEQTFRGNEDE